MDLGTRTLAGSAAARHPSISCTSATSLRPRRIWSFSFSFSSRSFSRGARPSSFRLPFFGGIHNSHPPFSQNGLFCFGGFFLFYPLAKKGKETENAGFAIFVLFSFLYFSFMSTVTLAPMLVGWNKEFDELVAYHAEHTNLKGPPRSTGLGAWVGMQRAGSALETMTPKRTARL
jgi:hypothetical protein